MEIIARIENGFREKFGVPRQSGLVPEVISRVVMAEKYSVREAFRGIEDYSHLWLLWEFDRAQQDDWRPTVRSPPVPLSAPTIWGCPASVFWAWSRPGNSARFCMWAARI